MIKSKDLSTVTMFVGLPGSGKTTFAASIVKWCNKHKKPVFSNVPILGSYQYSWKDDFGVFEMGGTIILDEAGLEVDNRAWEKNFDKLKTQFLKYLRHYGSNLVVFSQTYNDSDIKIRSMVGKLYLVRSSVIPFCSVAIPIWKRIDVDEETHDFCELYYKDGFFMRLFSCRRIFRPTYYKMFDSWDRPSMKQKVFNIYEKEVKKDG